MDVIFIYRFKREDAGNHAWKKRYLQNTEIATVESLKPNTTYQISVVGQNKLGMGQFSEVLFVKTISKRVLN